MLCLLLISRWHMYGRSYLHKWGLHFPNASDVSLTNAAHSLTCGSLLDNQHFNLNVLHFHSLKLKYLSWRFVILHSRGNLPVGVAQRRCIWPTKLAVPRINLTWNLVAFLERQSSSSHSYSSEFIICFQAGRWASQCIKMFLSPAWTAQSRNRDGSMTAFPSHMCSQPVRWWKPDPLPPANSLAWPQTSSSGFLT